jgi:DNA-binding response OmpR family regulator
MANELVLVVDDEAGITDFVSYNLEQAGYRARVSKRLAKAHSKAPHRSARPGGARLDAARLERL